MIAEEMIATTTPATMSIQKGLPVAITTIHPQTGQSSHTIFIGSERICDARTTPTISASAACRLGTAAYGVEASGGTMLPCEMPPKSASESTKPKLGNIRGGAVGSVT